MSKPTASQDNPKDHKQQEEVKETLKEEKNNPAVKDALKKEKQPVSPDDLSELHNNKEIGTSGGDQRASENELNNAGKQDPE